MLNKIVLKHDGYSIKSKNFLKLQMQSLIKDVFTKSLRCIEIKFGREFEGFESMRAEILRVGNDAIRKMEDITDNNYNIEKVPDIVTIKLQERKNNDS